MSLGKLSGVELICRMCAFLELGRSCVVGTCEKFADIIHGLYMSAYIFYFHVWLNTIQIWYCCPISGKPSRIVNGNNSMS
jgi:hypothetical protein